MRVSAAVALMFVVALGTAAAQAHARLNRSEPVADSAVAAAPHEVSLSFSEKLEPAFSSVQVTDSNGNRVDQGEVQVSGNIMRVELKPLMAGTYKVRWRALSVDTHTTEGNFSFTVGAP